MSIYNHIYTGQARTSGYSHSSRLENHAGSTGSSPEAGCWVVAHRKLAGVDDLCTDRAAILQPAPAGGFCCHAKSRCVAPRWRTLVTRPGRQASRHSTPFRVHLCRFAAPFRGARLVLCRTVPRAPAPFRAPGDPWRFPAAAASPLLRSSVASVGRHGRSSAGE
jgi:hypothetical protein